jgi:hypothetical protein
VSEDVKICRYGDGGRGVAEWSGVEWSLKVESNSGVQLCGVRVEE